MLGSWSRPAERSQRVAQAKQAACGELICIFCRSDPQNDVCGLVVLTSFLQSSMGARAPSPCPTTTSQRWSPVPRVQSSTTHRAAIHPTGRRRRNPGPTTGWSGQQPELAYECQGLSALVRGRLPQPAACRPMPVQSCFPLIVSKTDRIGSSGSRSAIARPQSAWKVSPKA